MTKRYSAFCYSVLLLLIAADRSTAQTVSFDDRPSLQFGTALRADLTARFQGDVHDGPSAPGADDTGFDVARRRIGVTGTVSRHLEFEVERELGGARPWRDAFVNLRSLRQVQLRAGQFKMPFSLEQLTSATNLDFVYRSRAADTLAPGRSVGAAVHGRLVGRSLGYEVGVFRRDGESARFGTNPGAGQTVAARLTVRPRPSLRRRGSLGDIEIGVNATTGELPEGRYSLRGRLTSRSTFFEPVFVKGRRLRLGADVDWQPGQFAVRAEFLRVDDERRDQGLVGDTLPPLRSEGWYLTGTWAVAGRSALRAAEAGRLPGGFKGIELAARVERLRFGNGSGAQATLRNPRSDPAGIDEQAWTFGINWSLNRWSRIQLNAIREQVNDAIRGAADSPGTSWTQIIRLQLAM